MMTRSTIPRWLVSLGVALCLMLSAAHAVGREPHRISVQKGIEKYVTVHFQIRRLSIGDTKIANVSAIDGNTLRVLGLANGRTTFSLWREGSDKPIVYTVIVAPDIGVLMKRLSSDPGFGDAHISELEGKIVLSGVFKTISAQNEARVIARYAAGGKILDLSRVATPEVVQVDAEVVAVSRSAMHALGLNFSDLGSGFSIAASPPSTLQSEGFNTNGKSGLGISQALPFANAFNLLLGSPRYNVLAVISALRNADYAETLARPTLVVRSGEKAHFLVGGEIPIPVPQGNNANTITIEYKKFGVSLSVEPKILSGGRIALKIKPSVSELDYANAVTLDGVNVPALRTRETDTTVDIEDGKSLLLAGLNFDSGSATNEKVPYLSDIPVIGEFFRRRSETHEAQELIIAVTPHIVTSRTQDRSRQKQVERDYMDLSPRDDAVSALHVRRADEKRDQQP